MQHRHRLLTPDNLFSRILVVAPSWIGDMVMAQPLLALLNSQGYEVDILALPIIKQLVVRMPHIHDVVDMPIGHGRFELAHRRQIGRSLCGRQYAQAIVLPNTLKSALIPFFAKIGRRTGFRGEMRYGLLNDRRLLNEKDMPKLVQRYYSLGLEDGVTLPEHIPEPELRVTVQQKRAALSSLGIESDNNRILVLCPGAEYGPAKRWPASHYARLASEMLGHGWHIWLFGSEKDRSVCDGINVSTDNRCLNLAGKTSLQQAIDLMSLASMVVTNDSGLMHIACALGIKTIALFGSTSPAYTPPLSNNAEVISLKLECSPCFQRECPLGHLDCLQKISAQQVMQRILS